MYTHTQYICALYVVQRLDKVMETLNTVHIPLLIRILCLTSFYFQYSWNPLEGRLQILNNLQWNFIPTSWSCFREVGGENLFLTLVSEIDGRGSIMFKYGDCVDQRMHWNSLLCSSNYQWSVAVFECKKYLLGKLHNYLEITSILCDARDYPTCPSTPFQ
jgi:hypothetical protein